MVPGGQLGVSGPLEVKANEKWNTYGTASIFRSVSAGSVVEGSRTSRVVGEEGMAASHFLHFIRHIINGAHIQVFLLLLLVKTLK